MFSSTTIESPARRSLRELMRDALGSALEFATLGEATIPGTSPVPPATAAGQVAADEAREARRAARAAARARQLGLDPATAASLAAGLNAAQSAPPAPPTARAAVPSASRRDGSATAPLVFAADGTVLPAPPVGVRDDAPATPPPSREHPHRAALRRPSRPRRPGAVPPRPPVCTMPVHR